MIIPYKKQNDYCRISIQNGNEEYSFDLDYALAFGLFKKGHENGGDKYLAFGVASTESENSPEVMDELLLRMLDVVTQSYRSFGISFKDMEKRIREAWTMAAIRFIKEEKNVSTEEAYELFKLDITK